MHPPEAPHQIGTSKLVLLVSSHILNETHGLKIHAERIQPILDRLETLHNFTIESQVQYHGRLAFQPQVIDDTSYALTSEDLTVFINSAEWSLCTSNMSHHHAEFFLLILQ